MMIIGRSVLFIAAALTGCGSVAPADDGGGDGDGEAPAVVSISPADGTAGVAGDAEIVVVFSEPMDQASVEGAWTSAELPATEVGFSWNAAGDTLTAVPAQALPLAEGEGIDPDVIDPLAFSIEIGTGATDLAGNPLAAAATSTFTTSRRLAVELQVIADLTRSMDSDGTVFGETAVTLVAGDDAGNSVVKTFVSFSLPTLPAGAALESAELRGNQNSVTGDPYALGALQTLHVTTGDALDPATFSEAPLSRLDAFSADGAPGAKSVAVTDALADDLANRDRTQYRLELETGTDNDQVADQARLSRSGFGLSLTYLID